MTFALVLLAHFYHNGVTGDDVGFLIVILAVVILTTGVIYRAALMSGLLIRIMIPEHFRDLLPNPH